MKHKEWRDKNKWRIFIYTENNREKKFEETEKEMLERLNEVYDDLLYESTHNDSIKKEISKFVYDGIRNSLIDQYELS